MGYIKIADNHPMRICSKKIYGDPKNWMCPVVDFYGNLNASGDAITFTASIASVDGGSCPVPENIFRYDINSKQFVYGDGKDKKIKECFKSHIHDFDAQIKKNESTINMNTDGTADKTASVNASLKRLINSHQVEKKSFTGSVTKVISYPPLLIEIEEQITSLKQRFHLHSTGSKFLEANVAKTSFLRELQQLLKDILTNPSLLETALGNIKKMKEKYPKYNNNQSRWFVFTTKTEHIVNDTICFINSLNNVLNAINVTNNMTYNK